jgi:hypothetical protein
MTALEDWSTFCLRLALDKPDYTYSIRKIIPDTLFMTTLDKSIELTNVGFKRGGSKLTMLKKYYYNKESIEKAKLALDEIRKKKDYGSVAFSTIGQEKKFTHHQHCIQSISIRHFPKGAIEYTVFYRAAEVIKIFTGDMVFLRDVVMPIFGKGPVTFVFANATLNAMYCPIMFIYDKSSWLGMLRGLYKRDKAFFKRFKKWSEMYFSDDPINYSSAEVIRELIHKHLDKKIRRAILNEFEAIQDR